MQPANRTNGWDLSSRRFLIHTSGFEALDLGYKHQRRNGYGRSCLH